MSIEEEAQLTHQALERLCTVTSGIVLLIVVVVVVVVCALSSMRIEKHLQPCLPQQAYCHMCWKPLDCKHGQQ
jgi:uncharacterized membrane protein YkvI